jgi:hypothetical protein
MKVTGNRALAAAYIDSRAVQDRLDEFWAWTAGRTTCAA